MCKECGEPTKWSWSDFFIGFLKRDWLVWIASTLLVAYIITHQFSNEGGVDAHIVIIWGIVTVVYLLGDSIKKAIAAAVANAEIKAQFGGTVTKTITEKKE